MNKLYLTKNFTTLLPLFLLAIVNVPVFAETTQNVSENEEVVEFIPKEKNISENEEIIEFIPEKKCDLNNHAAVSVENTTKTLVVHFDILDTPKIIDIIIDPKSEKHFCLEHGHIISVFTVNKEGVRVSNLANVRQLLPSAKHLKIKAIYNREAKKVEYDLVLDIHER